MQRARTAPEQAIERFRVGPCEIDPIRGSVAIDGDDVKLTTTELRVLIALARQPGKGPDASAPHRRCLGTWDGARRDRAARPRGRAAPQDAPVPVDLVTSSASGLDPHISPAAAEYQATRVARARHLAVADVKALVEAHTDGRTLGIFGEARVNVLALNRALDARTGPPR
jgi:hypothetical protein